jgi:hypothetical protein
VKNLLLFLCCFSCLWLSAQPGYWQQEVNFKIDVQLNDADHSLNAFAKIEYINHSPDTLRFIWFHLWPNAYRTDRTAFNDQFLENGRTDFYFSGKEDRGYINRLDFRINNSPLKTEDHPQHIDIIKVFLQQPLVPGASVEITTPFRVQLPNNFSRGGHTAQSYQVTQWYPKPAVYDKDGWHTMPYLDQGEFYNNFGNYVVQITVPDNYVVLSSGNLQNAKEKEWLKSRASYTGTINSDVPNQKKPAEKKPVKSSIKTAKKTTPPPVQKIITDPVPETKTLIFKQNGITDFAWFADKNYIVYTDTLQNSNGTLIEVYSAFYEKSKTNWRNSTALMKEAVRYFMKEIGPYPYSTISAVEAKMGFEGGMEYPCITSISPVHSEQDLEGVLRHEIGHNWFQMMLGSNERKYPWLDEGINSFYDERFNKEASRYKKEYLQTSKLDLSGSLLLHSFEQWKIDQPLSAPSDSLTEMNYGLTAYSKGAAFMKLIEQKLGRLVFDSAMMHYFNKWKFKHPSPLDLKTVLEQSSGVDLTNEFNKLSQKGPLQHTSKKKLSFTIPYGFGDNSTRTIAVSPVPGVNMYDGFMAGVAVTNYTLPPSRFQFLLAPMYGFRSKEFAGLARLAYTFYPAKKFQRINLSLNGMTFTYDDFTDTANQTYRLGFTKIVPSVKFVLKENNPKSTRERFIQWKTFLINEQTLRFKSDTFPNGNRFTKISKVSDNRYLNQLRLVAKDTRALYPYQAELLAEQAKDFVRLAFTGNYYFNYNDKLGANVRFFAGKFFYLGTPTISKRFNTDPFHLNMSGPKGYEDYTYSNYFIGRSEFEGFASQQMMMRDGGFKVRTDLLASKIGKTDDWLMALNFTSDIPDAINILKILPVKIPLKVYLDLGTYAEAWKKDAATGRLLYDAGLQLSLFKNMVDVYVPVFYSKVYKDYFQSTITEKRFVRNISFSINLQQASLKLIDRRLPF